MSGDHYKMSAWWIHAYHDNSFAKQNRILVKLLLNVNMYLKRNCPCCELNENNDVTHVLFNCQCNYEQRMELWNRVLDNCPIGLRNSLEEMTLDDRTKFILNAFNSCYIREWKVVYDKVSDYVAKVYYYYKVCHDEIE